MNYLVHSVIFTFLCSFSLGLPDYRLTLENGTKVNLFPNIYYRIINPYYWVQLHTSDEVALYGNTGDVTHWFTIENKSINVNNYILINFSSVN